MCAPFPPVSRSANGSDLPPTRSIRGSSGSSLTTGRQPILCRAEVVGRGVRPACRARSHRSGRTVARVHPDALLVDVNCWGALSVAEAGAIPWACFSPYTPPLRSPGVPPFGLGLRPMPGGLAGCQCRRADSGDGSIERVMLPPINRIRADVNLRPVASMDEFLRRAPLLLVASGKPFQYPQTDWGDAVQMIGPCVLDPGPDTDPGGWPRSTGQSFSSDVVGETGRRQPRPGRDGRVGR